MAEKKMAWLDRFNRDSGIKSSIIVFGNTDDIYFDTLNSGKYGNLIDLLIRNLKNKGYEKIVKWDRVSGIDGNLSDKIEVAEENASAQTDGNDYDLGDEDDSASEQNTNLYTNPAEFFPYMMQVIKGGSGKTAFILDYSDFIFGNANSLSDAERQYLTTLGKTLKDSQSYDMLSPKFDAVGNIVVLVTKNNAMIPPAFYLNNPLVSSVNISLPSRSERESFISENKTCLKITQNIDDKKIFDDLVDALDGFSLKEIAQLMKLSRQNTEPLSFEKLINLYKYGEKVSPWEELSKEKLAQVEERLSTRVKGQPQAIDKVKEVIIRAYTGFSGLQHSAKQKKPKGTLFFVGPTGVGKTELAKALAEFVFGDENACIRFDMSEYNHEQSDQRLVGAPPGYVGYEAGGQLTNAVKEKPFCVILFDEIEKAHGRILDKFLQILEDGRLTDGKGETVSFAETIIIFTSNIGAADVSYTGKDLKQIRETFVSKVKDHFVKELKRPELLNRIGDNIVAFNFISDPNVFIQIAKAKFIAVENFVKEKYKATLVFDNEAESFAFIAERSGIANGGRGLLNTIETYIVNPLSEWIFMRSDGVEGRRIKITLTKPFFEFDFA
ncbi:MAG: AAA family ATPase [Treponema sp.]|nr:AAA family ATPase [Treponema sp.]